MQRNSDSDLFYAIFIYSCTELYTCTELKNCDTEEVISLGQMLLRSCHRNLTIDGDSLSGLTPDHSENGSSESA